MGISIGRGGSGGSAQLSVIGEAGYVLKNGDQLYTREPYAAEPMYISDANTITGPPRWGIRPTYYQLGMLIGANGNITTDQGFQIKGAYEYIIRRIILCHASAPVVGMVGGLYTAPAKSGDAVIPAGQIYTALTDHPMGMLEIVPSVALRAADWLYLSLSMANGAPITFDIQVWGDQIVPMEVPPTDSPPYGSLVGEEPTEG